MQGDPAVGAGAGGHAGPHVLAGGQQLVQQAGGVVADAGRQDVGLPRAGGQRHPGELVQHGGHAVEPLEGRGPGAAGAGAQVLPVREEPGVGGLVHRLHLGAQGGQAAAADAAQHLGVAPFGVLPGGPAGAVRAEGALGHTPLRGQPLEDLHHHGGPEPEGGGGLRGGERAVRAGVAGHEVPERVVHRVQERDRHAHRQGHAQGVPQAGGVLHGGEALHAAVPEPERAPGPGELLEVGTGGLLACGPVGRRRGCVRGRIRGRLGRRLGGTRRHGLPAAVLLGPQPRRGLRRAQRADKAQQVRHTLEPAHATVRAQPLQVPLHGVDDVRVQQLAQLGGAEQLVEQRRVQGQGGGPPLGQGGVTLVDELGDVPEQQGLRERGRARGGHLHHPHGAVGEAPGHVLEGGQVVDVLQHLADGLQDHREVRVPAGHVQQLRGALPLLPQRRPLARVLPRQQQGPGGVLAEPGGEQGRAADLRGDDLLQLLGGELEQLRAGRVPVHQGQPQHDAVVRGHGGTRAGLDPEPLVQARAHRQRPRGVHGHAEGRVEHDPPVAQLVREPLHHERLLGGQLPGGLPLLAQVGQQVLPGPLVQAGRGQAPGGGLGLRVGLAAERAHGLAELGGAARGVPAPERQAAGLAVGREHEHPVRGDVHDPPARRAEQDHVPDAGLVDHLLVQLAHAAATRARGPRGGGLAGVPGLGARRTGPGGGVRGQEHPEQAAVRDGAAGGHGQALGAGAGREGAGLPVPEDARAQLGELVRGVLAGQQVQHGFVGRVRQGGERCGPAHQVEPLLCLQVLHRHRGDRVLGEDVQRVRGDPQGLDPPGPHPLGHHGGVHEVSAVLGEEHAVRDLAHLVAGTAHALQPGRHGRRRLDLDHLVHRAHVDAQLQRARGHHAADPPGLQRLLHDRALLLGHRAVVGAREVRDRARVRAGAPDQLRRGGRRGRRAQPGRLGEDVAESLGPPVGGPGRGAVVVPPVIPDDGTGLRLLRRLLTCLPDLVEPAGEALGEAAGVGEHERGAAAGDQVHDPLLHMGPDRAAQGLGGGRRGGAGPVGGSGRLRGQGQVRHVRDGHGDGEVPALLGHRADHVHRSGAAEEAGDLGGRLHRRGQADALDGVLEHRVESLEGDGQVGTALGAGHRVHLVHDHRVHPGQRPAGPRGEHQVQGLGRGDEDLRGILHQAATLGRRGVPGAHAHPDVRDVLPGAAGGLRDADQRRAQVALHVHAEGLERGDVEDLGGRRVLLGDGLAEEAVQGPQEGGEGLAGAGRRDDQGVPARGHRVPRAELGGGGRLEGTREPGAGVLGEAAEDGLGLLLSHVRPAAQTWWYGRPAEISWAR